VQRMRRVLLVGVVLTASSPSLAKCARPTQYYCVHATFERAKPELSLGPVTNRCFGTLKLENGKSVSVVFRDPRACPAPGAEVVGDLAQLCQDIARWTAAEFTFASDQEVFCGRSADAATTLARLLAASITKGMPRHEVRDRFSSLKFLEGAFTEKYYLHPHTVLEVTYDQAGGAYSADNPVSGPVDVKLMVLPQP
jgi:hypothetical protein